MFSCSQTRHEKETIQYTMTDSIPWAVSGIDELRPGDILVKPNINILPGTSQMEKGWWFGHAALVISTSNHSNADSLLMGVWIIESQARDVPRFYQIREVQGLVYNADERYHNDSFSSEFEGHRFRLRLNISEEEKEHIMAFCKSQKNKISSWAATKGFPDNAMNDSLVAAGIKANWADNSHWYCSLLVWQAVFYVTGIDLDPNGGFFVYPNDLIHSPYFDNKPGFIGRARF